MNEGIGGIEGTASQEGTRTDGIYNKYAAQPFRPSVKRPAMITHPDSDVPIVQKRAATGSVKLFADKSEIVKAIIYAEILGRRTQRR